MNEIRLIDANALKEDLRQYFTDGVLDGVSARLAFNQILHDIDNAPTVEERPQCDLLKAFELLKAHCKNRECNKDCIFYRELRVGDETEQFCGLCEIVTSDDKGNDNE